MTVTANLVHNIQVLVCHLRARRHVGNSGYLMVDVKSGCEADPASSNAVVNSRNNTVRLGRYKRMPHPTLTTML
jgi:hypothetical protein